MYIYKGISRKLHPDWLGWLILYMLEDNNETKSNIDEIKIQLEYEVKYFYEFDKQLNFKLWQKEKRF